MFPLVHLQTFHVTQSVNCIVFTCFNDNTWAVNFLSTNLLINVILLVCVLCDKKSELSCDEKRQFN